MACAAPLPWRFALGQAVVDAACPGVGLRDSAIHERMAPMQELAAPISFTPERATAPRRRGRPREAVPARALVNFGVRREPLDARTNPVIRAAVWLRDNL